MRDESTDPSKESTASEPVWTYRGYRLCGSEFTTAMVHLYRGETQRANVWRQRLDSTTKWVRLMETDFFAAMFVPPFGPAADWAEAMAENLLHPHFTISTWEAVGRRFRRNYLWIFVVLTIAWVAKTALFPTPLTQLTEFTERSAIGPVPGSVVIFAGVMFLFILFAVGIGTIGLQQATGEVLPRYADSSVAHTLSTLFPGEGTKSNAGQRAWFRPGGRRAQLAALIIGGQIKPQHYHNRNSIPPGSRRAIV